MSYDLIRHTAKMAYTSVLSVVKEILIDSITDAYRCSDQAMIDAIGGGQAVFDIRPVDISICLPANNALMRRCPGEFRPTDKAGIYTMSVSACTIGDIEYVVTGDKIRQSGADARTRICDWENVKFPYAIYGGVKTAAGWIFLSDEYRLYFSPDYVHGPIFSHRRLSQVAESIPPVLTQARFAYTVDRCYPLCIDDYEVHVFPADFPSSCSLAIPIRHYRRHCTAPITRGAHGEYIVNVKVTNITSTVAQHVEQWLDDGSCGTSLIAVPPMTVEESLTWIQLTTALGIRTQHWSLW